MKKYKGLVLFVIIGILFLISSTYFVTKIFFQKSESEKIINISELSEEFMDEYYEGNKNLQENNNKENILIVTSMNGIEDNYGAVDVVEAPNHQYFLQYETEEEKNDALKNLNDNGKVISVEENTIYTTQTITYNSWGIEKVGLDTATTFVNNKELSNDVTVAIIDTGCDVTLFNQYYPNKLAGTYNVLNPEDPMEDTYGHGTHIAGTIAEGTPSNVKILPIKVSTNEKLYNIDIINAINYITYNENADVINMSFGSFSSNTAIKNAIEAANQKNIITIAAAGNDNTSRNYYPASYDNTISIAAVDSTLTKAEFSNYGANITFAAPGVDIKSIMGSDASISIGNGNTDGDNDHETISGTSMATPHAAAMVAILKSFNLDYTLNDTIEILKKSAIDLGKNGWDNYYGYGLINFTNVEFCDDCTTCVDCDSYCFYKVDEIKPITKIEVKYPLRTSYNYNSINNLAPTELRIYTDEDTYTTERLLNLDGVEILNYDPTLATEQTVTVRFAGKETSFKITTNPTDESGWEYEMVDENSITITKYISNVYGVKKLYFPQTIDGYTVVGLSSNDSTFALNLFRDGMDKYAFEEIYLPSTITNIGNYSFYNMNQITKIEGLPSTVSIGKYAFYGVENLKSINSTITSIGEYAFYGCLLLDNITLANTMTKIENFAFYGCNNLEHINIPINLVSIGSNAFNACPKLKDISIPSTVTSIGMYAFAGTNINSVVIPSGITKIEEGTFYGCNNLKDLTLQDGLIEIDNRAFTSTNIGELYIPKTVTSIGEGDANFSGSEAFYGISGLEEIIVDQDNAVYDSRNNSNAIIETSTNKLVLGSKNTVIPNSVKIIGKASFSYNEGITEILVPDSVTEIQQDAFYKSSLEKITIPVTTTTIGSKAFDTSTTIWLYSDSYAKTYAVQNRLSYETINISQILITPINRNYKAFDVVDSTDITSVELYYDSGKREGDTYNQKTGLLGRLEEITNYTIEYNNDYNSFRYGDIYYIVSGTNAIGETFEKSVSVTVSKQTPMFATPLNLTAKTGQTLLEVELPTGFTWMDSTQVITTSGNVIYKARYTPEDTINYEIVEDIDITIEVMPAKTVIVPNITISDKTYDGTSNLNTNNISISNLNNTDYTITSAIVNSVNVGETTAKIKVKLTNVKFESTTLTDGNQEYEYTIDMEVIPLVLQRPTKSNKIYTYNESSQEFELNDYNSDTMIINGNFRIDVGEQPVTVSLLNTNYIWDNNTTTDLIYTFKIEKAQPIIDYISSNKTIFYDGELHGIVLSVTSPNNVIIKYMNSAGNYDLDEMPKYSDIGNYTIKYKLSINDNYIDIYGEQKLIINNSSIVNKSTDYAGIYDGDEHTINIDTNVPNYNIKYSINNTNYDLTTMPQFTDVGEYIINYKITASGYNDLLGSNKVKIYGIKSFNSPIVQKSNVLILNNNSYNNLINNIVTYSLNKTFIHLNNTKTNIDSDVIKTSDILKVNINNSKNFEYELAYLGDVNGNGQIDIIDYIRIMKDIMGTTKLSSVNYYAADVNQNDKIDIIDYIRIMKIIMEEN